MRIFIVHNPVSGTSDPDAVQTAIDRHFGDCGVPFERHVTGKDDPVAEIVQDAVRRGFDRVAAAGGDGTVSAVANGLLHTEVPLGILPVGSGNTFGREFGIPLKIEEALQVLTGSGKEIAIDTLTLGERHFIMNIGVGLSAATTAATERGEKRWLGKLAYLLRGIGELQRAGRRQLTIHIDDSRVRARGSEVVVANTGLVGFREVRLSPDIRPDDGRLHVCIVRAATLGGYLNLLGYALRGDATRSPELKCFPAEREVRIDADRPLPVQGDGDAVGETPVSVGIAPGSLRVLIPG